MSTAEERAIIQLEQQNQGLRARIKKMSGSSEGAVKQSVYTATAVGSSFLMAYAEARYPERLKVSGIDGSLLVGGLAVGAAAMGVGGKEYGDLLGMAGIGALCCYATKQGTNSGAEARTKGG